MLRRDTLGLTALLGLLTAFGPLATDIYALSMPSIGRLLHAGTADVQLTMTSYLIGYGIGQLVYGPLSDRLGRKPALVIALSLFCGASALCAAAPTIGTLIFARGLQALGAAGAVLLPRAIVRDLHVGDHAGRELSRIGAIMSLIPVSAPLVGGIVQAALGWRANFVIVVGVGITATAVVWRSLPETLPPRPAGAAALADVLRDCGRLVTDRTFLAHTGILGCSYAVIYAWISGSPFVLQNLYGLSPVAFSVAYAIACGGALAGGSIAATLAVRIGLDRTMALGAASLAAGGLAMMAALWLGWPAAVSLVLAMAICHAGNMLATPQAVAGALTPFPHCAGTASSLAGLAQQLSAALVATIVGHTIGQSAWPLAIAIAATGCLAVALWFASRRARTDGLRNPSAQAASASRN
ncbi:MAG TPA: multidrug effflux MFS transporter [Xanthobacteraceae bacterium]|nr:multidrug effflux MFS transporter [Xanthobacteraceae bacterium]